MSVVNVELPIKELEKNFPNGSWLCLECHNDLSTSMNVGLAKRGICERCGATRHHVYMIEKIN